MSRARILCLLLALATILVYWPATRNDFVNYDDELYLTQNPMVQRGLTWDGLQWAFTRINVCNWHPLTWLSHMADCELFRLNAGGHHFVSILIHAANTMLLFTLLFRLTGALWSVAFVAALFAWHPLHVESVAWAAERKDVLSTFFALLMLLAYVRYVQTAAITAPPPAAVNPLARHQLENRLVFPAGPCVKYYWLALLFFALGLMSKPMLVTMPCVMLLLDFWPLPRTRPLRMLLLEKLPFLLLTAAACVMTVIAQQAEAMVPLDRVSPAMRLENVITAYGGYLLKMIWPLNLAVFYPLPKQIPFLTAMITAAVLMLLTMLTWLERRRRPYLLMGWLWYLGTLVPVIGLVQVGNQAMADRYTYIPLIGIFWAGTFLFRELAGRLRLSPVVVGLVAGLILIACIGLTENQLSYWRDSHSLFSHALAVTKDNAVAHLNFGAALEDQGQPAAALAEYQETVRLSPGLPIAYSNIGRILQTQGKPEAAVEYCRAAMLMEPKKPYLHDNLGIVLIEVGRWEQAMREFDEALRLNPEYAPAHYQKGRLLLKQGHDREAVNNLRQAVRIETNKLQMLIYVARVLATDEDPQARNGAEALIYASQANYLAGTPQPVLLDTLALAYAELGRFDEAMKNEQQAVDLARNHGQLEDAGAMQQRLELYQKHQPWRESFRHK